MHKSKQVSVSRRGFLKGSAASAAALDIYAFIKSIPSSPAAKKIPLLNQIMNEVK